MWQHCAAASAIRTMHSLTPQSASSRFLIWRIVDAAGEFVPPGWTGLCPSVRTEEKPHHVSATNERLPCCRRRTRVYIKCISDPLLLRQILQPQIRTTYVMQQRFQAGGGREERHRWTGATFSQLNPNLPAYI